MTYSIEDTQNIEIKELFSHRGTKTLRYGEIVRVPTSNILSAALRLCVRKTLCSPCALCETSSPQYSWFNSETSWVG